MLDSWKGAGIDAQPFVMPTALQRDQEARSTFPGLLLGGGINIDSLASAEITSPSNRWNGANRGGWSNAEYDLLWERFYGTLQRDEQIRTYVQMMKLHSELVPNYPLHYNLQVVSHVAGLIGPEKTSVPFNIHEWEWQ
jgi:ABC-type transport system substrate-binding protein